MATAKGMLGWGWRYFHVFSCLLASLDFGRDFFLSSSITGLVSFPLLLPFLTLAPSSSSSSRSPFCINSPILCWASLALVQPMHACLWFYVVSRSLCPPSLCPSSADPAPSGISRFPEHPTSRYPLQDSRFSFLFVCLHILLPYMSLDAKCCLLLISFYFSIIIDISLLFLDFDSFFALFVHIPNHQRRDALLCFFAQLSPCPLLPFFFASHELHPCRRHPLKPFFEQMTQAPSLNSHIHNAT